MSTRPLLSLTSKVLENEPSVALVGVLKVTDSPGTKLPLASVMVTETEVLDAGRMVSGARIMATAVAGPATNWMLESALKPPLLARMMALPTVTGEVSRIWAMPLASVTAEAALSAPAVAEKLTVKPCTGLPLASIRVARTATLELPSATMEAAPSSSVRLSSKAAPALTSRDWLALLPLVITAVSVSVPSIGPAV